MALNYVFDASALAAGRHQILSDFNVSALTTQHGIGRGYPGMAFAFQGNVYQIVQNRNGSALTVGQAVSISFADAARTGNSTANSTKAIVETDDTHDAGLAGSRDWPGYIHTTAGVLATTAAMARREILKNTVVTNASTVTVSEYDRSLGPTTGVATSGANAYTTAPDATYDYDVVSPWEVVAADADAVTTSIVQGVVVSTSITDDYFGIIQVKGLAMANVDGTSDLVAGDLLRIGSTAGLLQKYTIAGANPTAAEDVQGLKVCGRILNAYTADSSGLRGIQLFGNLALIPETITL